MYYDRLISPELEAVLKEGGKLKWLFDFVKKRENLDLDFLVGANKLIEWISVYRGTSRIIRIVKGKNTTSRIKIDGDTTYVKLAEDLKLRIYTNNIEKLSNFEEHLKSLLEHISNDKKFDRYFKNEKEGYHQNVLSRKYGIDGVQDADLVIIDKEVVIGYENQVEKDKIFGEKQNKYRDLLKKISSINQKRYGSNIENNAIGNEMDFLALKSDGTLLLIELKHGTSTSGIYLSPLQIGLYTEIFEHYKKINEGDFYNKLKEIVEQKQRMGLIHKDWKIPVEITSIKPMLIISEYNPKSTGKEKFCEILAICREEFGETFLRDIEVRSYKRQQDKFYLIFTDIDNARQLFQKAGFDLPEIPEELALSLKQQSELDFSTRTIPEPVNFIDFYVDEANECQVDDYVILSRAIWSPSVNTIHYFLVLGPLRMFLQLCWGGFRIDADVLADQIQEIRHCFSLADQIVPLAIAVCKSTDRLTIVTQSLGSNNYWVAPGQDTQEIERLCHSPKEILSEVLQWLRNSVGDS